MGSFANALFKVMLGWLQGAASAVWSAFTSENGASFLTWIGRHWILVAGVLCVIGLAADLCVYLFRWRPYKVWKSFFNRNREEEYDKPEDNKPAPVRPIVKERSRETEERNPYPPSGRRATEVPDEPDLSSWKDEPETPAAAEPYAAATPSTITKSGYVVPADSPYRRPAGTGKAKTPASTEPEPAPVHSEENVPAVSAEPRRRRRIRVNELFTDPEEEIHEFDAPQHVIDARRAYHEPVYPRGWKKSEESDK